MALIRSMFFDSATPHSIRFKEAHLQVIVLMFILVNKTQEVEMNRSRSAHGTKPKPTCGADLGIKWEEEARTRQRQTWSRTVGRERAELKLTSWTIAAAVARHRDKWRQLISGPYSHLGERN